MIVRFLCWLGWCLECRTNEDDAGIWGECIHCHKRHGYVSRETLRAYLDRLP